MPYFYVYPKRKPGRLLALLALAAFAVAVWFAHVADKQAFLGEPAGSLKPGPIDSLGDRRGAPEPLSAFPPPGQGVAPRPSPVATGLDATFDMRAALARALVARDRSALELLRVLAFCAGRDSHQPGRRAGVMAQRDEAFFQHWEARCDSLSMPTESELQALVRALDLPDFPEVQAYVAALRIDVLLQSCASSGFEAEQCHATIEADLLRALNSIVPLLGAPGHPGLNFLEELIAVSPMPVDLSLASALSSLRLSGCEPSGLQKELAAQPDMAQETAAFFMTGPQLLVAVCGEAAVAKAAAAAAEEQSR